MTAPVPQPAPRAPHWSPHWTRATVLGRLADPLLLAAGLSVAVALLHVRDPHQSGSYGYCPWLLLTGTYCPGCGALRAVNDLTDGHVGAAPSSTWSLVQGLVTALPPGLSNHSAVASPKLGASRSRSPSPWLTRLAL